MKRTFALTLMGVLAIVPLTRAVDRVVTTDTMSTGAGSLTAAINALNDGDRITFNIPPGLGEVHWVQVPPDGFPIITKNNITIDGYTQPGATPNTASIHAANNAALKIVLCATNGNALSMYSAVVNAAGFNYPNLGFGDGEQAILGFFKATNAWTKGIAFIGPPLTSTTHAADGDCKLICFAPDASDISPNACQNFHVSGCWFGVHPETKQAFILDDGTFTVGCGTMSMATYATGTNGTPGATNLNAYASAIIGVAPGSTNAAAEFNVFVTSYGFDSQGGPMRLSGNFWNVLPDGVTLADMSVLGFGLQGGDAFIEFGSGHDIVIGTDGDGVNDVNEGNVFGGWSTAGTIDYAIYYYGSQASTVIAGNYFGVDVNGKSFGVGQNTRMVHHWVTSSTCQVRFGSDFNGVSDALEGNTVADYQLFETDTGSTTNSHWISFRGNSLTNAATANTLGRPPIGDGQTATEGLSVYDKFIDDSVSTLDIIPVIGPTTTTTSLTGVCGKPLGAPYTNLVVDVYLADPNPAHPPQGMTWKGSFTDNSVADSNPAVGAFTFDTTALGLAHGAKVTMTVSYTSATQPTIGSVARSGTQTTVKISNPGTVQNPGSVTYGIQKSATLSPTSWSSAAGTVGGTATFTDSNSPESVYRAQGPTALGQTSPFSAVFTIP